MARARFGNTPSKSGPRIWAPSRSRAGRARRKYTPISDTLDLAHLDEPGFDRLYTDKIEPCFAHYEPARVDAVKVFNKRLMLTAPIGVAVGVAIGLIARDVMFCAIATLIAVGIAYAWSYSKLQGVGRDVKIASLTAIAQAIGVNYSISVGQPPAFDRFRALKLLPSYDRSKFEDLFHGAYQGASFDLYEGHLETETRDSKGNTSYSTTFRGQIIRLAFPRKFLGVTIVRRDAGLLNLFGEDKKFNLKRVGLEDPKFEKVFEVYGNDQVEARYLVHPVLMERLMALETGLKGEHLRCGFEEGDLLIAVEGGDRFEIGDLFKPLADPERARKIVGDLSKVMRVMDSVLTAQAKRGV